ncbi:tyrosine-type recombinase/integrase [Tenuibacillus multivorans]|uniref:tyrosine-type recombinase/integrase n=1 Tax=Tenuibacillus multivorans TaxID=237069 RepID=UPI000ADCBEE9|nr:tyrosine-type recombinase/integrase [Tenuibacillus multivorans]
MTYIRKSYFNDRLKIIFKNNPQLKQISVHGFRHTHASLLFESGAEVYEVQDRLGHEDVQTTFNIYTHVSN